MTIKQSQLCVDRYEEIIINAYGEAHRTGYYAVNYHRAGAQTIAIYKGFCSSKGGCFYLETVGKPILTIAKGQPIPISQFLHAIGWEA